MDQFDRDLKRRAREEPFPLPDSFVQRLRETCDSLEEPPRRKPERRQLSHWGAWFAAVAASLLELVQKPVDVGLYRRVDGAARLTALHDALPISL